MRQQKSMQGLEERRQQRLAKRKGNQGLNILGKHTTWFAALSFKEQAAIRTAYNQAKARTASASSTDH